MKSLRISVIIAGILILLFLTGCTEKTESLSDTPPTEPQSSHPIKKGGIYRSAIFQVPASLDPALVQNQYGVMLVHQLFDGLVKFGPYLQIEPALAKTWTIADNGTHYRFTLRENARFHNGQPVTADDAAFSIQRLFEPTHLRWYYPIF